jgi:hypothetical protein
MARLYSVPLDAISVTTDADQDIWELTAPATKLLVLHSFSLTSSQTTDERVRLRLMRRTAGGTGGSNTTEVPLDAGNAVAATGALVTLATTPGTAGDIIAGWQWSQQGELLYLPTPEMRVVVAASGRLALNLQSATGGTRTWSGYVTWAEE